MKGNPDVIEALNEVLTAELTAINQYFIHAKMCENWGYQRLAKKKREESIEEMHPADKVLERVLYLEGTPNMQRLSPVGGLPDLLAGVGRCTMRDGEYKKEQGK